MSNQTKDRSVQSLHEDEVLARAMLWIGGAAILLLLLLLGNRYYVHYRTNEVLIAAALNRWALPLLAVLGLVAGAGGAALAVRRRKTGQSMKWPVALGLFGVSFAVCAAVLWKFHAAGVQILYGMIPTVAVLALVYYLYQREFFLIALSSAVGIFSLWLLQRMGGSHGVSYYLCLFLAIAFQVALRYLSYQAKTNDGMWKGRQILPKQAAYRLVDVTCILMAALCIVAIALSSSVIYYMMFPAVGWLVVMAVYFTVKLM